MAGWGTVALFSVTACSRQHQHQRDVRNRDATQTGRVCKPISMRAARAAEAARPAAGA